MISSPMSVKKVTLSATDNTNLAVSPSLSCFSVCRISSPGTTLKKRNPRAGRRMGIFKRIVRSVKTRNISMKKKNPLLPKALGN